MSIVREKLVKEDIELGYGTQLVTDPTDPTGNQLNGTKVGVHTFTPSVYSVKDFGADGDGVSDDTVAIQLAIDTAGADSVILFPVGDYLISDALTVTNSNVVLRGLGARWASGNGALIKCNDATANILEITGVDNVLVENLALRHSVTANSGTYSIKVNGGDQILIQDCTVVSATGTLYPQNGIGLLATATKGISNCRVRNCYLGNITSKGIWIVGYSATYKATNVVVEGCSIDNCDSYGIGIYDYCTSIDINNNKISNCALSLFMSAGALDRADHICVRDNTFEETTAQEHISAGYVENVLLHGNRFKNTFTSKYAIYGDQYCEFWSILGNHIINSDAGAIYWDGDSSVIGNNYIDWGSGNGLWLGSNSFSNHIFNNVVKSTGSKYLDSGASNHFGFNQRAGAQVHRCEQSYLGDSILENGDLTFYLNEAGNALTFKVKYAAGTVKTGTVALT